MEATTGVTPFKLQANLIVVDVEVNGRAGEFLLDTGAGATCLGRDFAEKVGVEAVQKEMGTGAGGDVGMELGRLDRLRVAGLDDADATCVLMDLDPLRERVGSNIDGILGFDFFGQGVMTVDYPGKSVRFDRAAARVPSKVTVEGPRIRLPRLGFALSAPSDAWTVQTDTPLPTIPVILEHASGARVTFQEVAAHGLTLEMAQPSLEGSLAAQVSDFRLLATATRERAGRLTLRIEHSGVSEGAARRFVTEGVLTDAGMLVVACEMSADDGPEAVADDLASLMESLEVLAA